MAQATVPVGFAGFLGLRIVRLEDGSEEFGIKVRYTVIHCSSCVRPCKLSDAMRSSQATE